MEAESKPINNTVNESKRKNSDIDTNDRPAKRARTDSDGTIGESGFSALSKDILIEISYHLDVYNINAMFSASKGLRNHISETAQFWRQMVLKKYPGYELRMPDEHEEDDTLPWRDIFIGTQRKLIPPSYRLENFMQLARSDPKQSEADLLYNTRKVLAKLEFQNGLLDQVENFLDDHPTMWLLWESRFLYTCHRVLPGVEFSAENLKWDVTCTTPVQLTIIGKNGQALMIDTLTSSFACYWGYGFHSLIKYEVMSVFDVSSAMRIFDLPKEVIPKTPYEDNNEDKIIKKLINEGWEYINKVLKEEWKQLLDQIGLSDVDVDLFVQLIRSAAFPAANRKTSQFYTETTGYYGTSTRHFDNRGANRLPGVGGEMDWGLPPVKTGNAMVFKDVNY